MAQGGTRVMQQRRLRAELRRIRSISGHTQKSVAEALNWSTSKVIRIETGATTVSTSDVMALLHFYGISDQGRTDELVAITRTKEKMWWDGYRDHFSQRFLNFLDYENSAARIRQYMDYMVPGLLQVEGYIRAVMAAYDTDAGNVERGVQVRLRRQQLLAEKNGRQAWFLIDEAVLHRWIGGPGVLVQQLRKLNQLADQPNISIRVVPYTAGMHRGISKPSFTIMEFPLDDEAPIVNVDSPHREELNQVDQESQGEFIKTFHALEDIAASEADSTKIIDAVIDNVRMST
jgi:transcriptional regulator with XRE-family HTH domain